MTTKSYDVIIVGAGPSGSECARSLASSGARVLMLDKKRSGWHKPCGGGVSEIALRMFEIPTSMWFETAGVRIFEGDGTSSVAPVPFYDVRRNQFDEFLSGDAAARGVEVRLETTIQKLARTAEGFEVETKEGTCHASYLVGADGFSSTVRDRLFSEKIDAKEAAIALEYWFEWEHGVRNLDFYIEPELLPLGYSYAFPKDPHTITIGIAGLELERPREVLERMLELPRYQALKGPNPHVAVHGARIPYKPLSQLREGRLLLLGDAAGLNTPIAFAGIPIALISGRIAGQLLAQAISSGSDAPLDGYTVAAIAEGSPAFRACHVYWRHLVHHGSLPGFPEFFAQVTRGPHDELMFRLTWDMLRKLSGSLDLSRLRSYAGAGTISIEQPASASS